MKALTIYQPTAAAVIMGDKDIENRPWQTPYRGPFLVHAGRTWDDVAERFYHRWLRRKRGTALDRSSPLLRHGVILGIVDLVDIVENSSSPWAMDDCWHWVLANPRPFAEPIPAGGKQGWWNYDLPEALA